MADPAKSMVGPLEELYLVSFIADGDEQQAKIERALRAWADKWMCQLEYTEAIDTVSLQKMSQQEQADHNRQLLQSAKQKMGEALAIACATFREGPLNDVTSYQTGTAPAINYRNYSMFGVRRWER
jgi:hypothetical protein